MTPPSANRLLRGVSVAIADLLALRGIRLSLRQNPLRSSGPHGGSRLSRHRGRGVDFAEVRLYQPGDDVRSIDWRVTARKAKPHTKVYREERERPTLLVVDQSHAMLFGSRVRLKSVAAAECAALLAWHAFDSGDRVGGVIFDDAGEHSFKPYRNPRAVVRFLSRLQRSNAELVAARGEPCAARSLEALFEHLIHIARNGFRIYLISDFGAFDAACERQLRRLARHNHVALLRISDPLERELPPPETYAVTDGVTRRTLSTADRHTRSRYRDDFDAQTQRLADACASSRSEFLSLSTDEPLPGRLARLAH
jgi:uncharacterized protein (DUF58 family)